MTLTPTVFYDCYVDLASGTLVADHANKAELNCEIEDLDATTFGQTAHVRRGGLMDGTVGFTFLNDFTAANLDSIFWAWFIAKVPIAFEIRPTSSAVGTGNPKYTGQLLVKEWKPIGGDVGKLVTVSVSFPTSGVTTRATS